MAEFQPRRINMAPGIPSAPAGGDLLAGLSDGVREYRDGEWRADDGKRGYIDGFEQGWRWALEGVRRGLTPEQIAESCEQVQRDMEDM